MAQYQHLPIYKVTYDLLLLVTKYSATFTQTYKYTLGDKLRAEIIDMVVLVYKANSSTKYRVVFTQEILEKLQAVELMLRLAKDLRQLSVDQFAEIVVLTDNLGRQAQGWFRSSSLLVESE